MENIKIVKLFEEAEAILFDMDGVIIDTDDLHDAAKKGAIEFCGVEIENEQWNELRHYTSVQIYAKLLSWYPSIKITEEQFIARKSKIFTEIGPDKIMEIAGAFDFVIKLKEKGKKIALVTASRMDTLGMVSKKYDLKNYFDIVLSREDVAHSKPDPEAYLKAAKLLNTEPQECVVIEDSVPGIKSGKSAGCKVVGKMTSNDSATLLEAGADVTFENYDELL